MLGKPAVWYVHGARGAQALGLVARAPAQQQQRKCYPGIGSSSGSVTYAFSWQPPPQSYLLMDLLGIACLVGKPVDVWRVNGAGSCRQTCPIDESNRGGRKRARLGRLYGAQCTLATHRAAGVEHAHHRSHRFSAPYGGQTRHTSTDHKNLRGGHAASRGDLAREETACICISNLKFCQ